MRDVLLGIMILLLASCGKNLLNLLNDERKHHDPRPTLTTNAVFTKYIRAFEDEYGAKIGDVPVNFAAIKKDNVIAVCNEWASGEKDVEISQKYWNNMSEEQREELIFHELGHCVLNLDHTNGNSSDSCPLSIMNQYAFNEKEISNCYIPKRDLYMQELFGR